MGKKKSKNKKWERIGVEHKEVDFIPDFIIYTKGICNVCSIFGEGGSAYVIVDGNNNIVKSSSKGVLGSTNNRVELLAILSALRSVPDNSSVLVITDSQYSINVFSKRVTRFSQGVANKDILLMYETERKRFGNIAYKWVKGHSGDYYSTIVEALADERRSEVKQIYRLPTLTSKHYLDKQIVSRANKMSEWLTTDESKAYRDTEAF